jgi:hypothetical protein
VKLLGKFEAAFAPEVDVDQRHVGPQFLETPKRVGASRCASDDGDALALQQAARGVDESRAVVDD